MHLCSEKLDFDALFSICIAVAGCSKLKYDDSTAAALRKKVKQTNAWRLQCMRDVLLRSTAAAFNCSFTRAHAQAVVVLQQLTTCAHFAKALFHIMRCHRCTGTHTQAVACRPPSTTRCSSITAWTIRDSATAHGCLLHVCQVRQVQLNAVFLYKAAQGRHHLGINASGLNSANALQCSFSQLLNTLGRPANALTSASLSP